MQCAQTRNQITSIFFPQYHSLISVVSSVIVAMIDQLKLDVAVTNYYYSIVVKSSKNVLQKKFSLCCLLRCKFFSTFSFKIHYMFISIHSFILITLCRTSRPTRSSQYTWTHWFPGPSWIPHYEGEERDLGVCRVARENAAWEEPLENQHKREKTVAVEASFVSRAMNTINCCPCCFFFLVLNRIYLKLKCPFIPLLFTFPNDSNRPLFFRIAILYFKAFPHHNHEREAKCSDTL